jgi:hypothetical protein
MARQEVQMRGPARITSRHTLFALALGVLCAALPASAGSDTIVAAEPTDRLLGWTGASVTADEVKPANGNLLVNPTFDGGVNDWAGSATWDPRHDASGNSHSGSLKLSSRNTPPHSCAAVEQCFAVSPGTYLLSAKVLVLTGDPYPPSNAHASIHFTFYTGTANDNCTRGPSKTSDPIQMAQRGQGAWTTITAGPFEAPQEARSVGVVLLACSERDVVEADFDDLVFQRVPPAANPPR